MIPDLDALTGANSDDDAARPSAKRRVSTRARNAVARAPGMVPTAEYVSRSGLPRRTRPAPLGALPPRKKKGVAERDSSSPLFVLPESTAGGSVAGASDEAAEEEDTPCPDSAQRQLNLYNPRNNNERVPAGEAARWFLEGPRGAMDGGN
jgi:hypothetical protein